MRTDGPAASRANLARYRSLREVLAGAAYGIFNSRQFGYADPVTVELWVRP